MKEYFLINRNKYRSRLIKWASRFTARLKGNVEKCQNSVYSNRKGAYAAHAFCSTHGKEREGRQRRGGVGWGEASTESCGRRVIVLTDLEVALDAVLAALAVVDLTRVVVVHNFDELS